MSDRRLVYLSGEPGVGKSTLMREVTAGWDRVHLPRESGQAPHRDLLFDRAAPAHPYAVELGRLKDTVSGTDALALDCINEAEEWLRSGQAARESSLILAEGSRLAHRRFLTDAVDTGWQVQLLHLSGLALAATRRANRGRLLGKPDRSDAWVKGRRTAAANLALAAPDWGVQVLVIDANRLIGDHDYHEAVIATCRGSHPDLTPR